jgi:hypothetical protein
MEQRLKSLHGQVKFEDGHHSKIVAAPIFEKNLPLVTPNDAQKNVQGVGQLMGRNAKRD